MVEIYNYREFRLDNGLVVALQETPTKTVSGRLRVWHGALNENKGEEGLAHFLEHTLIRGGSLKYDPAVLDNVTGTFGEFNAFTSLDRTFFPVRMLSEDTQEYIEHISDVAFNPRFDASRIEEERQRVLRETADYKSDPFFNSRCLYGDAFFGKNSPHTYLVLGNENVVRSASEKDLRGFHDRGYYPNNMDLILVGALPKNIERLIEKSFGSYKPGNAKRFEFPRNSELKDKIILHEYAPEFINKENPNESSAVLSMSLFAPTETDEDHYATLMLTRIFGEDTNSRLYTVLSQRKGLAYEISAQYDYINNRGGIYIGGSVHASRIDEATDAIFEEMAKLCSVLVLQDELDRLKKKSRYNMAKIFEKNSGHVQMIEAKMDKGFTPEYHFKKIEEVTPEKIRDAAIKYFPQDRKNGKYVISIRDPLKEL